MDRGSHNQRVTAINTMALPQQIKVAFKIYPRLLLQFPYDRKALLPCILDYLVNGHLLLLFVFELKEYPSPCSFSDVFKWVKDRQAQANNWGAFIKSWE